MQMDVTGQSGESRSLAPQGLPAEGATIQVFADKRGRLPPAWEGDA